MQRAHSTRAAIDDLYDQRLGSEAARLTAVMLEAKQPGAAGGAHRHRGDQLRRRAVAELPLLKKSITFSAVGSYPQLRGFINLLELSPSFLSLDEIRVSGGDPGRLRLQVRLSTMFVEPDREDCRHACRGRPGVKLGTREKRLLLGLAGVLALGLAVRRLEPQRRRGAAGRGGGARGRRRVGRTGGERSGGDRPRGAARRASAGTRSAATPSASSPTRRRRRHRRRRRPRRRPTSRRRRRRRHRRRRRRRPTT